MVRNLPGLFILVIGLVLMMGLTFFVEAQGKEKDNEKQKKEATLPSISATDSRQLNGMFQQLQFARANVQMAKAALATAEANQRAAQSDFNSYTEHLGRLYGFDPSGKDYTPNPDGTSQVSVPKSEPVEPVGKE